MAALERKPMRLNGIVGDTTDKALYDALSSVTPRRRMALLRRLANVGLMVEQGRIAAEPSATSETPQAVMPVALSEPLPAGRRMEPTPLSSSVVSKPMTAVPNRVVTAKPDNRSDADTSASDKPRGPNLALMGRMNLSIME